MSKRTTQDQQPQITFAGRRRDLERLIQTVAGYAAINYRKPKTVLIGTQDGSLALVAEGPLGAIQVSDISYIVDGYGHARVPVMALRTALGRFQPRSVVRIRIDGATLSIDSVSDGPGPAPTVTMPVVPVQHVPTLGEPNRHNGIVVAADRLFAAFAAGGAARGLYGSKYGIVKRVYVESRQERGRSVLRVSSTDGRTAFATFAVPVTTDIGARLDAVLLDPDAVVVAKAAIAEGDQVELYSDDVGGLHLLVAAIARKTHIRLAPGEYGVAKYPIELLRSGMLRRLDSQGLCFEVYKASLVKLLSDGAAMAALDPKKTGGEAREVRLAVEAGEVRATVPTGYRAAIGILAGSHTGPPLQCTIKWGVYGPVVRSAPVDPIRIVVLDNEHGDPVALALTHASDESHADGLPNYVGVIGISDCQYMNSADAA